MSTSAEKTIPKDAIVISWILRSLGVVEVEPKVILQLLEFVYKYSVDVLADASHIAEHHNRACITAKDVRLSLQTKVGKFFISPTPRQYMSDIACFVNGQPISEYGEELVGLPDMGNGLVELEYEIMMKKDEKE